MYSKLFNIISIEHYIVQEYNIFIVLQFLDLLLGPTNFHQKVLARTQYAQIRAGEFGRQRSRTKDE
jgi:hypothetical protein